MKPDEEPTATTKRPLFTTGYAGFDVEGFLWKLRFDNVECVVDVRDNPVSRNKAFSQPALRSVLEANGIKYVHAKQFGVPPQLRHQLRAGGRLTDYFEAYGKYLDGDEAAMESVLPLLLAHRCCLLCLEKNPDECHRSVLANRLAHKCSDSIEVKHI